METLSLKGAIGMINVAIFGAGGIAEKMARTLQGMVALGNRGVAMHCVASRDLEKARRFAGEYGFEKACGSYGKMMDTGVDMQDSITLTFTGGEMAVLCAAVNCARDRRGVVYGTEGTLSADNINNPLVVTVTPFRKPEETKPYRAPEQITGFEYEV
jgi:predicted dehydrogenase